MVEGIFVDVGCCKIVVNFNLVMMDVMEGEMGWLDYLKYDDVVSVYCWLEFDNYCCGVFCSK